MFAYLAAVAAAGVLIWVGNGKLDKPENLNTTMERSMLMEESVVENAADYSVGDQGVDERVSLTRDDHQATTTQGGETPLVTMPAEILPAPEDTAILEILRDEVWQLEGLLKTDTYESLETFAAENAWTLEWEDKDEATSICRVTLQAVEDKEILRAYVTDVLASEVTVEEAFPTTSIQLIMGN